MEIWRLPQRISSANSASRLVTISKTFPTCLEKAQPNYKALSAVISTHSVIIILLAPTVSGKKMISWRTFSRCKVIGELAAMKDRHSRL